jgi:hypothetical protein
LTFRTDSAHISGTSGRKMKFPGASFKTCRWLMAAGELPSVH